MDAPSPYFRVCPKPACFEWVAVKRRWKRTEILNICDGYEMLPCVNGEKNQVCVCMCDIYTLLLRFLWETLVNGTKEGTISMVSIGSVTTHTPWDDEIALYMHLYY